MRFVCLDCDASWRATNSAVPSSCPTCMSPDIEIEVRRSNTAGTVVAILFSLLVVGVVFAVMLLARGLEYAEREIKRDRKLERAVQESEAQKARWRDEDASGR